MSPPASAGAAGDLVEGDALDGHLGLEHLQQVPGDGLALAVLVRGQQQLVEPSGPFPFRFRQSVGDALKLPDATSLNFSRHIFKEVKTFS